jgi:hypothetical protein
MWIGYVYPLPCFISFIMCKRYFIILISYVDVGVCQTMCWMKNKNYIYWFIIVVSTKRCIEMLNQFEVRMTLDDKLNVDAK